MGQLNIFTDHSSRSWEVQVQSAGRFGLESRSFSFQIKSKQNRTKNPDTFCQQKSTFWSLPLLQRTLILSWEPHPHDLQENWIPNKDLCEWGWVWGKIRVNTLTHICAWTAGSNAWLLRLLALTPLCCHFSSHLSYLGSETSSATNMATIIGSHHKFLVQKLKPNDQPGTVLPSCDSSFQL